MTSRHSLPHKTRTDADRSRLLAQSLTPLDGERSPANLEVVSYKS